MKNYSRSPLLNGIRFRFEKETFLKLDMALLPIKDILCNSFRLMWPAVGVLFLTTFIAAFLTRFVFVAGLESFWKIILRFFRLSIILTLPTVFLPYVSGFVQYLLNQGNYRLIQVNKKRNREFDHWDSWLVRPLQCIGLAMLITSKFVALLQIYTGEAVTSATILPPLQFSIVRFLSVTAIAMATALLLSVLWMFDDLGIRYVDRKRGEVKMIGKYVGIVIPVFFGFYGILHLFQSHEWLSAMGYVFQITVVLYPPAVVMTAFHFLYVKKHKSVLLRKLKKGHEFIFADKDRSHKYTKEAAQVTSEQL